MSSTSPVTAGLVALVRSAAPSLTPAECRRILRESGRAMELEGRVGPRVPDALVAVRAAERVAELRSGAGPDA